METALIMKLGLFSARRADRTARTEQATYEELVEQGWDALWRYAYRTTGNRDDAEDLLSETLLEGFHAFAHFRGDTTFVRWMYRIMTTTRIDMVRKANRRRAESLDNIVETHRETRRPWEISEAEADPETLVLRPMLSEPVQRALDGLPEEFRQVVVLADMEQMDYAEVSRILSVPMGTVRSRLHRARGMLRKALAAYVEEGR